jgi:hypothetical protein
MERVVSGSRALVASSDSRTLGSPARARALLLAAGELGRVGLGLVGETDEVEQFPGLAGALLAGRAEDLQRQLDVVLHGPRRQQVEVLEDHADTAARPAQLPAGAGSAPGEGGEVLSGDGDRAGGGTLQQVDAADERGLAGAGLADDAVHLAFADVEIDAVQGGDLTAAGAVDLGQACGGDHVGFRHCRAQGVGVPWRVHSVGTRHGSRAVA